jgi:hypothetical protein
MQPDDALNDAALDRELRRALSVDPSPEFVARVRMRVANEPARMPWRASWGFAMSAVAAIVMVAIVVRWVDRGRSPVTDTPLLAARAVTPSVGSLLATDSYAISTFRRTVSAPAEAGHYVRRDAARASEAEVLLDPRETAALRALIRGVRSGRLDLTPVLRASTPTAMELPPVTDVVIAPLAIEPLAPTGAEGVRQ